jgi:hypothetical protein
MYALNLASACAHQAGREVAFKVVRRQNCERKRYGLDCSARMYNHIQVHYVAI